MLNIAKISSSTNTAVKAKFEISTSNTSTNGLSDTGMLSVRSS